MRKYIRHPSDIPIEFRVQNVKLSRQQISNISAGGVAFRSLQRIEVGRVIDIKIPTVRPVFQASCRVAWCLKRRGYYDVGVQFSGVDDAYRVRMVEQICHIEQYKRDIRDTEGRELTGEQAAFEWIQKYAAEFPPVAKG